MQSQNSIARFDCPACGYNNYQIVYSGPIRDGIFGRMTDHPVNVLECTNCRLQSLEKLSLVIDDYSSATYRKKYNNTVEINELLDIHDPEQADRLKLIGIDHVRNKTILDYGCGHGAFLDVVSGVAKETYGIEPFKDIQGSLTQRGHYVFSTGEEALSVLNSNVDVVTCFGVIEHVEDPVSLLLNCYNLLSLKGSLYLQTDNLQDLLMVTGAKNFPEFFYRTAHRWYFSLGNLEQLVISAGFSEVKVSTKHGYDFSNFLQWHKEGRPTGLAKTSFWGKPFESFWRASIEENGYGELITIVAKK